MPTETAPKARRKPKRNYSKELERLQFYVSTVIRIKSDSNGMETEFTKGQLQAYTDISNYLEGK